MAKKVDELDEALLDRLTRLRQILEEVEPDVLGHRVRRLRDQQQLSIREVAERAAISKNSIVRLEQGRGTQPITLLKVCSVLGTHVERLADPSDSDVVAVAHSRKDDRWFDTADMGSKPLLGLDRALTEKERAKAVAAGARTPVNLLRCRLPNGRVLPSVLEISRESATRSHVGEEFVYVLSGAAIIKIGRKRHRLREGESLTFWSAEPHSYAPANPKQVPVRILSVRVDG